MTRGRGLPTLFLPALFVFVVVVLLAACTPAADPTSGEDGLPAAGAGGVASVGPDADRATPTAAEDSPPEGQQTVQPVSWQPLPPAPLAVTEVAGAAHAGEVWAVGGLDVDGRAVTTVQRWSPVTGTWATGPDLPVAVHHAALVSTGGTLLLLGGYVGDDFANPTAVVWVLAEEEVGWRPAAPLPAPRAAGAAAFDGRLVAYGGGVGPDGLAGEVWVGGADGWTIVGLLGQPREHLAAAGADGRVWFMGGRTGGLDTNLGHVDLVISATEAISALGEVLPPAGGVGGFADPEGRACMVGGESTGGTISTVACIDVDGHVTALPDLTAPRHGLAVAMLDGVAHAVLGGPRPGLFVSDAAESLDLR